MSKESIRFTRLRHVAFGISILAPIVIACVASMENALVLPVLAAQAAHGTATRGESGSSSGLELPVIFHRRVESGRTPVGTAIQAKLTAATLVEGVVVPEGAKLYGEITESSVATVADSTSYRLAIRMDSASWKIGSKPVTISFRTKVFLTAWYYPLEDPLDRNSADTPPAILRNPQQRGTGTGTYPTTTPRPTPPFPTPTTDSDPDPVPPAPKSTAPPHRELMKDVELIHNSDGSVVLTSKQSKIKLDNSTTYVLSSADLVPTR